MPSITSPQEMTSSYPSVSHVQSLSPRVQRGLQRLVREIEGEVRVDSTSRMLYATDASIYDMDPLGVVLPKHEADLIRIVEICGQSGIPLIPRAGGTSLSGQCVGDGLVLDISKYMNQILEQNLEQRWIWAQPGVIQDHINFTMAPHGLHFGPDTSTSNRAMIGGMIGNNSCGSHSIYYGTTVDHVLELEVILSDGSKALFCDLTPEQLEQKKQLSNLEGHIYREITRILEQYREQLEERYPKIVRKNNGYMLDQLLREDVPFNMSRLICASEGTLALVNRAKLKIVPSPKYKGIVAVQFAMLREALVATVESIKLDPAAVELIDKKLLDLSKDNLSVQHLRFFLEGDPEAVLAIEFYDDTREAIEQRMDELEQMLRDKQLGYTYPRLWGEDIEKVWQLRKAGLGVLYTLPGDAKPVTFVEDTAVAPEHLPAYIEEFQTIVQKYETTCVYYAHASVGEL
ncbi:MAG: FAD-binding oxidoreductase, partial [Myxococcota bacterium]